MADVEKNEKSPATTQEGRHHHSRKKSSRQGSIVRGGTKIPSFPIAAFSGPQYSRNWLGTAMSVATILLNVGTMGALIASVIFLHRDEKNGWPRWTLALFSTVSILLFLLALKFLVDILRRASASFDDGSTEVIKHVRSLCILVLAAMVTDACIIVAVWGQLAMGPMYAVAAGATLLTAVMQLLLIAGVSRKKGCLAKTFLPFKSIQTF